MHDECNYSFWDLFEAANNRKPTNDEKGKFKALTQGKRNKLVKKWAGIAGWGIDDRMGTDGKIYTAFCPLWMNRGIHTEISPVLGKTSC